MKKEQYKIGIKYHLKYFVITSTNCPQGKKFKKKSLKQNTSSMLKLEIKHSTIQEP